MCAWGTQEVEGERGDAGAGVCRLKAGACVESAGSECVSFDWPCTCSLWRPVLTTSTRLCLTALLTVCLTAPSPHSTFPPVQLPIGRVRFVAVSGEKAWASKVNVIRPVVDQAKPPTWHKGLGWECQVTRRCEPCLFLARPSVPVKHHQGHAITMMQHSACICMWPAS